MRIQGAIVKEQGITFAIVVVKPFVIRDSNEAYDIRVSLSSCFPGMPIILMAQDARGTPTYQGREDIVRFLSHIHISQIPWKEYNVK